MAEDREAALERRQEELDAKARDLHRINWKAWKKRGSFAFTATSAALMYDEENPTPAALAAIAAILNVLRRVGQDRGTQGGAAWTSRRRSWSESPKCERLVAVAFGDRTERSLA